MNNNNFKMKDLPQAIRPYEKCIANGAETLSDAELLAVLLRTGSREESSIALAYRILSECAEDNLAALCRLGPDKLCRLKGIGKVKAVQILCAIELGKRLMTAERREKLNFTAPEQIAAYFMPRLKDEKKENVWILLLDGKCRLLHEEKIYEGTVKASLISPREIFISALEKEAVYLFLLHNHPSGDPTPSNDDFSMTKRIRDSGRLLGIELLDHIIIGDQTYVSFSEKGFM